MTSKIGPGLVVAVLALALAACGGSSKPAYCANKDALQADINNLPNDLKSGGMASLQTSLKKLEADAKTLISNAKGDFPSETQAIQSSINGLKTSIQSLGSSLSPQTVLALLPQAQSVVNSVKAFEQAASSKCK